MTLTAGVIVDTARDQHSAFDGRRNPERIVLRALSRYQKELAGKVAAIDETALVTDEIVSMPLLDHEDGIDLPANRYIAGISAMGRDGSISTIDLIPWATRLDRNAPFEAAWVYGQKLYLRSPASAWSNVTEIGISYIAAPGELTSLTDELILPDTAESALVAKLAHFMALRGHNDPALPAIPVAALADEAARTEGVFLTDIANRLTGTHFKTRDVWWP